MKEPFYNDIFEFENIYQAYKTVVQQKKYFKKQLMFSSHLEENIIQLQNELMWFEYKPEEYNNFIVKDPKERNISAPSLRDRIVQTAVCNVIEPWIERQFDYDSYACRKNKGSLAAANRVSYFMGKPGNRYYLYCDVHHYFNTVNIENLEKIVSERFIKDKNILWLLHVIMWKSCDGTGLKIGGRWSQLAANTYLNELDFFIRQNLHACYYIRYMDDFILFSDSKNKLNEYLILIKEFLLKKLYLSLNEKTYIGKTCDGLCFVGYYIRPYGRVVRKTALDRTKSCIKAWKTGRVDNLYFCNSMASRIGHCKGTASYKWYCEQIMDCLRFELIEKEKVPVDQLQSNQNG